MKDGLLLYIYFFFFFDLTLQSQMIKRMDILAVIFFVFSAMIKIY